MIYEPNIDVKRQRGPYCGPTAIALLTGEPISRIEAMIRRRRKAGYRDRDGNRKPIKGTYPWEITRVLKALDCNVYPVKKVRGLCLREVVEECLPATGVFLVEVTGHMMVASGGMIADNSYPKPIPVKDYKKKMRRVCAVWRITRKPIVIEPEPWWEEEMLS
jgi:hypothetical protein